MYKTTLNSRILALLVMMMTTLGVFAQTWETVRDSEDYIYGEGWGKTVAEAERQALGSLISKIASSVTNVPILSIPIRRLR